MSKILITGGNGQLGMEFRKFSNPHMDIVSRKELDILDFSKTKQMVSDGGYEYIVNCAAYTAVDQAEKEEDLCFQVNVAAVRHLAEVCAKSATKLIHISSDYVYHPDHDIPLSEEDNCNPRGVYAKSKLLGERAIREVLENHLILRTSWVYSSHGKNFVKTMLRLGKERDKINVVNDQIGSPTYTEDLVQVIKNITENTFIPGTYNFSNAGFISWSEFAKAIFKEAKITTDVNSIPTSEYPTPAIRPHNSRLIKSKITETFSITLQHWHKSLIKCLKEIDN